MPGEPVCRRESRAGEPVVDSGYMELASLLPTCSLLHEGRFWRKSRGGGEQVKKGQLGLARRLCEGEGLVQGLSAHPSFIRQSDRQTDRQTQTASDEADDQVQ